MNLDKMTKARIIEYVERINRDHALREAEWIRTINRLRGQIGARVAAYADLKRDIERQCEVLFFVRQYLMCGAPRKFIDLPPTDKDRIEYEEALNSAGMQP